MKGLMIIVWLLLPVSVISRDAAGDRFSSMVHTGKRNTTSIVSSDANETAAKDTVDVIEPLALFSSPAYQKVTTDSISRWQLWSDQGEWLTRQPGVISFQQGGLGRNDGYLIRAHESRHQQLFRDGIPLNERIFGSANRKRLPHYSRIASVHEFTASTRYRSEYRTLRYHVTRPFTLINYEQTAYEYRSTEGFLTRNITPSTNFALAYWGKNEGDRYPNLMMGGRNVSVSMYHYLNDFWIFEGEYSFSGLQLGEPDGYVMNDMTGFHFDRFNAIARERQADSSMRNSLFRITAYHREHPGQEATSRLTFYHDRYRRLHYDATDSSFVRTLTTGLSARHVKKLGPLLLQGDLYSEGSVMNQDRYLTMNIDSWIYSQVQGIATLPLPNNSQLHAWIRLGHRNDGYIDHELGTKAEQELFAGLSLYASYARGEQMPHPGQLYWNRPPVEGNAGLKNEILQRIEAGVRRRSGSWNMGGEVYASVIDRPVLVGEDHTFVQAGSCTSAGATGWMAFDGNRLELSLSATFQQYFSDDWHIENQMLDRSGQRVWTRASFYYKNYVYNSAAFVKTGFYLQVSPTSYRSSQYYPAMDYWDPNSRHPDPGVAEAQALPEFARLDLEMTARVRSAIFLFRLENALDNWLLPGYFETAYHPMPSMRLRFGIRWVLRN